MKKKLVQFVNKREQRFSVGAPSEASLHSRGYHRYFEGYTEVERIQRNGRKKIERIYTGTYHIQELDGRQRILLRFVYVLLWLLAAALFVISAAQAVGSNTAWYVNLCQAVSVAALFWILCTLCNYLTAPIKLTIHDYHTTSGSLKRASFAAGVTMLATVVMTLLYLVLHLHESGGKDLLCAGLTLLAAVPVFAINRIEYRIAYREERSENAAIENGNVID